MHPNALLLGPHLRKAVALAEPEARREIITDALALKLGAEVDDPHPYAAELADGPLDEEILAGLSNRPRGSVARGISYSDLASALDVAVRKFVGNTALDDEHRAALAPMDARDYKKFSVARTSESELYPVREHGEIRMHAPLASEEAGQVETFAAQTIFSRASIINQDWPHLAQTIASYQRAAMHRERDRLMSLAAENPSLGDGTAQFHADRSNLITLDSGAALSSNLGAAFAKLRSLKDGSGTIGARGRVLLIDANEEFDARVVLEAAGMKNIIVIGSAALVGVAVLLPDPDEAAVYSLAMLENVKGPVFDVLRQKGSADGVAIRCRHEFDILPVSHRAIRLEVS